VTTETERDCRLYLITPPAFDPEVFKAELRQALDGGDVSCLQLRLKDCDDDAVRQACDVLQPVTQEYGVAFIVNDRPDLAAEMDADGVHVGQQDYSYGKARDLMGPDRIVGVTCHDSRHLAMTAGERGADYVAFGAFFPTETKDASSRAEPEILTWWQNLIEIPCVAIGGITVENCPDLVKAGADFLAVVGGVWNYKDGPTAAVRDFNKVIAENLT
jgi:thiamine-phosphate pyrophosphorylase